MTRRPNSAIDLFSDAAIRDPHPAYDALRAQGALVWLEATGVWAVTRWEETRAILADWQRFTTAQGVAIDPEVNAAISGPGKLNSINSEPPLHDEIRRITGAPLRPAALAPLEAGIRAKAREIAARAVAAGAVEAMTEIAQALPLSVVSDLVGLPPEGRARMLDWAAATFDTMGPMNARARAARPVIAEYHAYCTTEAVPGRLAPGGWAARLYEAAARGELEAAACPGLMREYIGPSLDTTIFAIGSLLYRLGTHPEAWAALREDRSLLPGAILEGLRLDSPIRGFTRLAREAVEIGGVTIPQGDRVLVLYACANRDPRRYPDPHRFDITRAPRDHLAFGFGIHNCTGQHLARMEITALLEALLDAAQTLEAGPPEPYMNNLLGGHATLPLRLTPAPGAPLARAAPLV